MPLSICGRHVEPRTCHVAEGEQQVRGHDRQQQSAAEELGVRRRATRGREPEPTSIALADERRRQRVAIRLLEDRRRESHRGRQRADGEKVTIGDVRSAWRDPPMARWYGLRPRTRRGSGPGHGVSAVVLQSNRGRSACVCNGSGGRCRSGFGMSIDAIPTVRSEHTVSTSTTKRRLASVVSLSAVIATMVVAAAPTATLAASGNCRRQGRDPRGQDRQSHQARDRHGHRVTLDDWLSTSAPTTPRRWMPTSMGPVTMASSPIGGGTVNMTSSQVHEIGDSPRSGSAVRPRHPLLQRRDRHDQRQQGLRLPEERDRGSAARTPMPAAAPVSSPRSTVVNNDITGNGPIDYIAQNGIVVRAARTPLVKDNTVQRPLLHGPDDTEATGLLNYDAGRISVPGNTFVDTETRIDGAVKVDPERPRQLRHDHPLARSLHPLQERGASRRTPSSASGSTGSSRSTDGRPSTFGSASATTTTTPPTSPPATTASRSGRTASSSGPSSSRPDHG